MEISLQNVWKTFGYGQNVKHALRGISFSASAGKIVGVLGPNGAGKTTTTRILLGILEPDDGSVVVDGGSLSIGSEQYRNRIGFLPEERALYKRWKVKDTIAYFGLLKGMRAKTARVRAAELAELFEITPYWNFEAQKLSKGLSQRVQLISTFIHDPSLIVVDEPFSGLDPVTANTLRTLLKDYRAQGKTIVICSHQMREVEAICDEIIMLMSGEIVLKGSVAEICAEHGGDIIVSGAPSLSGLTTVETVSSCSEGQRIRLVSGKRFSDLLAEIAARDIPIFGIERAKVTLEEVFVKVVRGRQDESAQSL